MLDYWVLYQFDSKSDSCRLRYVMSSLKDATAVYKSKNLHLETADNGGRSTGDVGIVVHNQMAYFESNIPNNVDWGDLATYQLQICRDRAVEDGFLTYEPLIAYKCFYMHAMDFSGEFLDKVIEVDVNKETESGEHNVVVS